MNLMQEQTREELKMMKEKGINGLGTAKSLTNSSSLFSGFQFSQGAETKGRFNMKKLMVMGAAALCGAVALADVTSANIVGYQNKEARQNFNYVTPTFRPIAGVVDNKMSINEVQVDASVDTGMATLQFVGNYGGATFDNDGKVLQYLWVPAAKKASFPNVTFPEGGNGAWAIRYTPTGSWVPQYRDPDETKGERTSLFIGECVQVTMNEGKKVQFSGEVGSETIAVMTRTARQNFNYFGNPFPMDISINNIQMDDKVDTSMATLQFVGNYGGATFDNDGKVLQYLWVPAAKKASFPNVTFPEGGNGAWAIRYTPTGSWVPTYRDPDPTKGEFATIKAGEGIQITANEGNTFYVLCPEF